MTYSPQNPGPRLSNLARTAIGACGLALIYAVDPVSAAWMPKCPLHELTGLHCPGCGVTRALHALVHGDLAGALSFNLLFVCAAPVALAVSIQRLVDGERAWNGWTTSISPRWIWAALGLVAVFAILRNLPLYPFTLLAPH